MAPNSDITDTATAVANESDSDVFLYVGLIQRGADLDVIRDLYSSRSRNNAILILVTAGGDPHAAYKIARYIQSHFQKFTLLVSGLCKSAGTLIAVGAHELAFAPYGELGPIDVQTHKTDNLAERQSGLTITESLDHLTTSAILTHGRVFGAIMDATNAVISFKTAAQAASELVTGLYAPMFSQIDPMEVGEKARSMRIASDYGMRLDALSRNLKGNALNNLTQTYPSHSFVIDMQEARGLFVNVRPLSDAEQKLVDLLGLKARYEGILEDRDPEFSCLSTPKAEDSIDDISTDRAGNSEGDRQDPSTAVETPEVPRLDTNQVLEGRLSSI